MLAFQYRQEEDKFYQFSDKTTLWWSNWLLKSDVPDWNNIDRSTPSKIGSDS